MKKVQKIALACLITLAGATVASASQVGGQGHGARWQGGPFVYPYSGSSHNFSENPTPTDRVPDFKPSNRTGEPVGWSSDDIMAGTK
jgi:hypothetical protein